MSDATKQPSCPRCGYDLSGAAAAAETGAAAAAMRERGAVGDGEVGGPTERGVCSECGNEFAWSDAYRAENNYFDDLPRVSAMGGLWRSLRVALVPWASRRVPSAPGFSLWRSCVVSLAAMVVWHAMAAAWVLLMRSGWLLPWGTGSSAGARRVVLMPWNIDWGYVSSGAPGGAMTMHSMGGDGMMGTLGVFGAFWLGGVCVLGAMLLAKRAPGAGTLFLRAAVRSAPSVGLLTLLVSTLWLVFFSVDAWLSPPTPAAGETPLVVRVLYALLILAAPGVLLFVVWSRHVRDTGVFTRVRAVAAGMVALPLVALIVLAAWRG